MSSGRISESDLNAVRAGTHIDEIVRDYVALKPTGGGSFVGLCPFHDERSPSFHVTPARSMYYCFGCQSGGDAISFLRAMHPELSFVEAVERLAERAGITLTYEDTPGFTRRPPGERARLLSANKAAEDFFGSQLDIDEAKSGRAFLEERNFTINQSRSFGVGYAPRGWNGLTNYLKGLGYSDEEIVTAGLGIKGERGVYDRFRGRLVWPIRDLAGATLGFGARKLYEDDEGPKFLNTPETPLYKKSNVLYGIDLARRPIVKERKVVVVEGYADVMACHLAGVDTAVAACGTAFGEGHIRILRRLLMDDNVMRGEVIFTFDGDAAGQKAALRAFEDDQRFVAQTFIAVEPHGWDPCDVRQREGDAAVRELVAHRIPLFEFAIRSVLAKHDLERAEGRVAALRESVPIVARIKDPSLRPEYTRHLAGWIGLDVVEVSREVRRAMGATTKAATTEAEQSQGEASTAPHDPTQREALKCMLQEPQATASWFSSLEEDSFTSADLKNVFSAILAAGDAWQRMIPSAWASHVVDLCPDEETRATARGLIVEPLTTIEKANEDYSTSVIGRLLERTAARKIDDIRGRLQRSTQPDEQGRLLSELVALENYRRQLLHPDSHSDI